MASMTPEVRSISQRRQRTTEPQPQVTRTTVAAVVLEICSLVRTNCQLNLRQSARLTNLPGSSRKLPHDYS